MFNFVTYPEFSKKLQFVVRLLIDCGFCLCVFNIAFSIDIGKSEIFMRSLRKRLRGLVSLGLKGVSSFDWWRCVYIIVHPFHPFYIIIIIVMSLFA